MLHVPWAVWGTTASRPHSVSKIFYGARRCLVPALYCMQIDSQIYAAWNFWNYTNENVLQIDTSATVNEFVIAIGWAIAIATGERRYVSVYYNVRCDIWSVRLWANSILFAVTHILSADRRFSSTKTGFKSRQPNDVSGRPACVCACVRFLCR